MRPTIWLKPGILIIYGTSLDADTHKHQAIQLVCPTLTSLCKFNEEIISGPLIINSKVEHQLQMKEGWILLIEPKSELGEQLLERLGGNEVVPIDQEFSLTSNPPNADDDPSQYLLPLFNKLALKSIVAGSASTVSDSRIEKLLNQLNNCLPGGCLKPTSWRASDVAQGLSLSEGRFLHLFSEQMGIPWRPYLLWHRMICAINALTKGSSATDAAHLAGFSDSAHLSRTFKSLFGMSIRDGLSLFSS